MLTLRVFVEGAAGAETMSVIELLGSQPSAEVERVSLNEYPGELVRIVYEAGNFEGSKIRIEVAALHGASAEPVSTMRKRCDAVVVVVDSLPDGINAARQPFGQLVGELVEYSAKVRPVIAIFAHHQDRLGACPPSEVASGLRSEPVAEVIGTSSTLNAVRYGMALVVTRAVGALKLRETAGRQRHEPEAIDELVRLLCSSADASVSAPLASYRPDPDSTDPFASDQPVADVSMPSSAANPLWPAPTMVSLAERALDSPTDGNAAEPAADDSTPAEGPGASEQLDRLARRGALRRLKASLRISADPPEQ
jgi:hypothetical protein